MDGVKNLNLGNPLEGRLSKPRSSGLTMLIDKGIGLRETRDLLEVSSEYIDFIKLSFGTSLLYPVEILIEKINLIKSYGVYVYPGGTLFEIAVTQNKLHEYLFSARELGFTALEVSNGTISLYPELREEAIYKARSLGFLVLTEVGKKDEKNSLCIEEKVRQIETDLSSGADYIIIEGRESGKGISIYDDNGNIRFDKFDRITKAVEGAEDILIWEAPLKKQQIFFINKLGPNVNLGNIQIGEIVALEALRRGLRGDTFGLSLNKEIPDIILDKETPDMTLNKGITDLSRESKGSITGA